MLAIGTLLRRWRYVKRILVVCVATYLIYTLFNHPLQAPQNRFTEQDTKEATHEDLKQVGKQETVLFLSSWSGREKPYLESTMRRFRQQNGFVFLLLATDPDACSEDGRLTRLFDPPSNRFKVHCVAEDDFVNGALEKMCEKWACSKETRAEVADIVYTHFTNWQRDMTLRPLTGVVLGDLMQEVFPDFAITHWFRVDMDVFLGDWAKVFPKHALAYDLITFKTVGTMFDWSHGIWLKGYLTGFRLTSRISNMWTAVCGFESAESFQAEFGKRFKTDKILWSIDEGAMSVGLMMNARDAHGMTASWIVLPELVMTDREAACDSSLRAAITQRGLANVSRDASLADIKALIDRPIYTHGTEPLPLTLAKVQLHQDCPKLTWLRRKDRVCLKLINDDASMRDLIAATPQVQFDALSRKLSPGEAVEANVSTYANTQKTSSFQLLGLHLIDAKYAVSFWQHTLPVDGAMTIEVQQPYAGKGYTMIQTLIDSDGREESYGTRWKYKFWSEQPPLSRWLKD